MKLWVMAYKLFFDKDEQVKEAAIRKRRDEVIEEHNEKTRLLTQVTQSEPTEPNPKLQVVK